MTKRKVVFVNQYCGSPNHGNHLRNYYLGKVLQQNKVQVEIVTGSFTHLLKNSPCIKFLIKKESINNIFYTWLRIPKYGDTRGLGRLLNMLVFSLYGMYICFSRDRSSIFIISSPSPMPVLWGIIRKKMFGSPFFVEIRDIWPESLDDFGGGKGAWYRHLIVKILDAGYRDADGVIYVQDKAKVYFIDRGAASNKLHYIPNGFSSVDLQAAIASRSAVKYRDNTKITIGYLGSVGHVNGVDQLLNIAELAKNTEYRIFIIGDGARLEEFKQQYGQLSNVTFFGRLHKVEALSIFYHCVDIGFKGWLSPNVHKYGVSPQKLFDYLSCAKPVLNMSRVDDISFQANCVVEPSGRDASNEEILTCLSKYSREELREIGLRGRDFAFKRFEIQQQGNRLLEIIQDV